MLVQKRAFFSLLGLFLGTVFTGMSFGQSITLDAAIDESIPVIIAAVPKDAIIAVLNIETDIPGLSGYVVEELIVKLINTRSFTVIPRREVEFQATKNELDFQMSGYVSDESAKSLGQFLGAETIINGTFARDTANSFRLVINIIDVESFAYKDAYRASIKADAKINSILADSGVSFYQDYTTAERLRTGVINIAFGLGSAIQGDKKWWRGGVTEALGVVLIGVGAATYPQNYYERSPVFNDVMIVSGSIITAVGVGIGFIIPFFYHKQNSTKVSLDDTKAWSINPVSLDGKAINGVKIAYTLRF
jgi:TolB-like protein